MKKPVWLNPNTAQAYFGRRSNAVANSSVHFNRPVWMQPALSDVNKKDLFKNYQREASRLGSQKTNIENINRNIKKTNTTSSLANSKQALNTSSTSLAKIAAKILATCLSIAAVTSGLGVLVYYLATNGGGVNYGETCFSDSQCKINMKCTNFKCTCADNFLLINNSCSSADSSNQSSSSTTLVSLPVINLNLFNNSSIKRTLNSSGAYTFANPNGIASLTISSTYIYLSDTNVVVKFDYNGSYITHRTFSGVRYIGVSLTQMFLTSSTPMLFRSNENLTSLNNLTSCDGGMFPCMSSPYGIYYDIFTDLIYIADSGNTQIHIFNKTLKKIDNIDLSTAPHNFRSIATYNGTIYVGTVSNSIYVVQNKTIIRTYNSVCATASTISSIFIDNTGSMLIPCSSDKKIRLLNVNGTWTGKEIALNNTPIVVTADYTGRILVSHNSTVKGFTIIY